VLTEMLGKGGNICPQAKSGEIRCPLIVRPNSEDVITGHLFQALRCINPRWWLARVVDRREVRTNGRGIPRIPGHYQPLRSDDIPLRDIETGELFTAFESCLDPVI
jgi:hypothetical protein